MEGVKRLVQSCPREACAFGYVETDGQVGISKNLKEEKEIEERNEDLSNAASQLRGPHLFRALVRAKMR